MGKQQAVKFDFPLALIGQKGEKAKLNPKYISQSNFIGRKGNCFLQKERGGVGWPKEERQKEK